ncbi:hypothetical protein D1007_39911 [Hordeum vulgare]|nr:hypothetical protein D1007_39911 [Hordeum vulgare]
MCANNLLKKMLPIDLPSPSGMMENVVIPTLKVFSLRAYGPKHAIACSDKEAVVISPSGGLLASIELPAPLNQALVLEDFCVDGLTRQSGALFFGTPSSAA